MAWILAAGEVRERRARQVHDLKSQAVNQIITVRFNDYRLFTFGHPIFDH